VNRLTIKSTFGIDEAGTIEGVAWPFDSADAVGDVIERGAFGDIKLPVPMLAGHRHTEHIGEWDSVTETSRGLEVKGRLFIQTSPRAREISGLIRKGRLSGLSVAFHTKHGTRNPVRGVTVKSADLVEISIVRMPAHPGARITVLKSADAALVGFAEALVRAASALNPPKGN
jgi:HK97 family phage prohead protease